MTTLYVVRHAIAEPRDSERWPDDALRPLTADGQTSFRRAARGLRRIAPDVEVVLSSPYLRAWQTAEILNEEVPWPMAESCDELRAECAPADGIAAIEARGASGPIAVVGHEPQLSGLVGGLVGEFAVDLKKGGIVRLERSGVSAVVRWIATPKMLRTLAES